MLTTEPRLQRLEDEVAIRELASRFADAGTRNDIQAIKTLFCPDVVFSIGKPNAVEARGPEGIGELIQKLESGKDFFVQFVHSGLVKIDGSRASARWLIREIALGSEPGGDGKSYYNNFGFFHDELEKTEGKWLFKSRTYQYIYLDTDSFTGKAIDPYAAVSFT